MRVLFLADAVFEDKPGGSRVVAGELARGLARRGHEIVFLVAGHRPEKPDDERSEGVRVVRYPGAGRAMEFLRAGRAACARLWAERPFDVVHTHFAYAACGPLQAVDRSAPHLRSFYGPWDAEGWVEDCGRLAAGPELPAPRRAAMAAKHRIKRALRHRVETANLGQSERVIVLSEQSRREVLAFGYPAARIHKIVAGVDCARFRPTPDKQAVRREMGLPEGARILLSVRRLAPRMGLDNLIRAMPALSAGHPDVLLLIGGKGPERERLESLVRATGMGGQVRLVGFLPEERLAAYYQAADLFVLPTTALEGFGLVTVEALACGTPVVGTPVGATPEILGALDQRLLLPDASPDGLAEGIGAFLENDWSSTLTPERLSGFVRERYSWDRHVEATLALYTEVVADARRRRQGTRKTFFRTGAPR